MFGKLTTYHDKELPRNQIPLENLDDVHCTHILGMFKIIVNGKLVPKISYGAHTGVNVGYWIEELSNLLNQKKEKKYIIFGCEQGDSAYRFVRAENIFLMSVIDCPIMEGKEDAKWQDIRISMEELKEAFEKFRQEFLKVIEVKAPNMLEKWSTKFSTLE